MRKDQIAGLTNLKLAVDNAYDHVVITDPEGMILYVNKAAEKLTGYTFEEMKGHTPRLWGAQMGKSFYRSFWKTIKTEKKFFVGELQNKRKNGELYSAEIRVSPVLDENRNVRFFVGIERDITKEKEVDRMKTEFISLTSHQLMTPLTAIKLFLDFLSSERFGKLNKRQKEFVRRLTLSNENMIKLVSSLLNIARLESGRILVEPRPTDLYALAREVVQELKPKIKSKKQKVNIAAGQKIPLFNLDDNLIRNVYINLLTNAIKYTPKGGSIGIEIKISDGEVLCQVSDTGYGIPFDEQEKVFQKFFRAGNIRKVEPDGTGLGLYLVKLIVETAGGKIWFKSEEGRGTTFLFTLPISGMKARRGEVRLSG